MSWTVIYAKITDDKKNGVKMDGPSVGPIREKQSEAEAEARRLIEECRNATLIPRLYEISNALEIPVVLNSAKEYYKQLYNNMLESKEALSRPVRRKKRRKLVAKEEEEKDNAVAE